MRRRDTKMVYRQFRLFVASGGVVLAGGVVAPIVHAAPIATPPATCAAMTSPYDYTQQAASQCYLTNPLVSVTALPDGGSSYNYSENGQLFSEVVPPASFDILTASATALRSYGLPARPTSQPALAQWQSDYQNAHFATPPSFLAAPPQSAVSPAPPLFSNGSALAPSPLYANAQFAGYDTAASGTYTSSSAQFTEPSLAPVSCGSPAVSTWSGLGSTSSAFGQDGTVSYPNSNHHAFVEVFHTGASSYSYGGYLFTGAAHDSIRANVNYSGSTFSGTVTDVTTGVVNGWNSGSGYTNAPNQVAAVVEQPVGYDMANFSSIPFSYSQANGSALSDFGAFRLNNSPNTTTGSINGSGGFNVSWNHC